MRSEHEHEHDAENDLPAALERRQQRRLELERANAELADARTQLAATTEAQIVRDCKAVVAEQLLELARAQDAVEAIEEEIRTGMTGLPIFDRPGPPEPAAVNGHADAPKRRGRPRKAVES